MPPQFTHRYPTNRKPKRPKVERVCSYCSKSFLIAPSEIDKGRGKFCSRQCFGLSSRGPRLPLLNRFLSKVRKTGTCWIWEGHLNPSGYGVFRTSNGCSLAHRVSYELHIGAIPKDLHCCHSCDVPACVNPDHLWLGTNTDNQQDRITKKLPGGGARKLTESQVIEIRKRYAQGNIRHKDLAVEYNVSKSAIYGILSRKKWKHLP